MTFVAASPRPAHQAADARGQVFLAAFSERERREDVPVVPSRRTGGGDDNLVHTRGMIKFARRDVLIP